MENDTKSELFVFEYLEDAEIDENDVVGCGRDIPIFMR